MAIIVPNVASSITTNGSVVDSENKWVWVGARTALAASGTAVWYRTSTSTSGCELMGFSLSPGQNEMFGPFNSPNGVSVTGIVTASAIVWMKSGSA